MSAVLRLPHWVNSTPVTFLALLPKPFLTANIPTLDLDHHPAGTRHKDNDVCLVLMPSFLQAQAMKKHRLVRQLVPQDLPDCSLRATSIAKERMDGNEYRHTSVLPAGRPQCSANRRPRNMATRPDPNPDGTNSLTLSRSADTVIFVGRIVVSQPGAAAVIALRTVLDEVRAGDPLAPVDVIVPTGIAGVTVRRAVAGESGLANVRFSALPQVAERLAARHLALSGHSVSRPLTATVRSQAVRATVASADGTLARAATHRATLSLLDGLMAELDEVQLDPAKVARAALSANGFEVMDLFTDYRSRVGKLVAPRQMLLLAIEAIDAGNAPQTHVILYSPSRLADAEKVFLRGLHERGRLSAVVSGSPDDTTAWLGDIFGEGPAEPSQPVHEDMHLTVAPDAEEEVRLVVRTVLDHLAEAECCPERIGIAYRASTPYARLLREQLKAAGVPHHMPSQSTLGQTIAGRTALGLLDLRLHDFPRADVIRWLSDGPLVDPDGHRLPADWWDRISRDAGVARGAATWADRLELYAVEQERQAAELGANSTDRVAACHRRAAGSRALATFVASVDAASDNVVHATSWAGVAESLTSALKLTLGKRSKVDAWSRNDPPDPALAFEVALEQSSCDAVLASVAALAELDESVEAPTPTTVLDAMRTELDRSVSSGTTLGRGVLVGPFSQFVGSDVDLLCVVGMTEDSFPPRTREHAILRDADRRAISPELRTVAARRSDERERWLAVLHSARRLELSYPRADTRSQRRQFAAPWFLEQATRLNGDDLVGASQVDVLDRPWLRTYPSFVASLDQATTFTSAHELDVAYATFGGLDALAAEDPRLQRGVAANQARMRAEFGPWTGHTGRLPDLIREQVDPRMSATALQKWATCPTSHFIGQVLGSAPWRTAPARTASTRATRGHWSTRCSNTPSARALAPLWPPVSNPKPPGPQRTSRLRLSFSRPRRVI
jgi:ATP-dependent helicase/nuclease subunit B